jgi:hypothetical protein
MGASPIFALDASSVLPRPAGKAPTKTWIASSTAALYAATPLGSSQDFEDCPKSPRVSGIVRSWGI